MPMLPRGALIVIEGVDKVGKSTQCSMLVDVLNQNGRKAQLIKFPARETLTGRLASDYLQRKCDLEDHAIHLIFSANRWEYAPKMLSLLQEGVSLIVDRYSYSGVAYSASKKDMDLSWCKQSEVGLPKPDAVLYLTLPSDVASKRQSFGEERYENIEMQKEVTKVFEKLISTEWMVIKADKSIEDLHKELKCIVENVIRDSQFKEIEHLWK